MNYKKQSGTFQDELNVFSKGAEGIANIMHEVLLLEKFLQTKPQVKNKIIKYYDLGYTVIKTEMKKKNQSNMKMKMMNVITLIIIILSYQKMT